MVGLRLFQRSREDYRHIQVKKGPFHRDIDHYYSLLEQMGPVDLVMADSYPGGYREDRKEKVPGEDAMRYISNVLKFWLPSSPDPLKELPFTVSHFKTRGLDSLFLCLGTPSEGEMHNISIEISPPSP